MADLAVLGVDGCPGGWLGVLVRRGSSETRVSWLLLPGAAAIVETARSVDAAAVDMPIGLPDDGPRLADVLARRALGPRGPSVFPAPVRAVLGASSYAEACARSRAASGRAIPLQVWHLLPRIADLDAMLTPALQARVVEAHPELCFTQMEGHPLAPKRSPAGVAERAAALARWLPEAASAIAGAPRPARAEDAADALACAWTAARWVAGAAYVLPHDPPRDARGLRMEIVS